MHSLGELADLTSSNENSRLRLAIGAFYNSPKDQEGRRNAPQDYI